MNEFVNEVKQLQKWVGREERKEELLTRFKVEGFNSIKDISGTLPLPGDPAAYGTHWILESNTTPQSELDRYGQSRLRSRFFRPVNLPRRM